MWLLSANEVPVNNGQQFFVYWRIIDRQNRQMERLVRAAIEGQG